MYYDIDTITKWEAVNVNQTAFMELLPYISKNSLTTVNANLLNKISSYTIDNDLTKYSVSNMWSDLSYYKQIMDSLQYANSLSVICPVIQALHDQLSAKPTSVVKNWVDKLRGLHPSIDRFIDNNKNTTLYYFKDVSEYMGSIILLSYSDINSIDVSGWGNCSFLNTEYADFREHFNVPHTLKQATRFKLDTDTVSFTQNMDSTLLSRLQCSLPNETWITTAPGTGNTIQQIRPITSDSTQGAHLNSDWYHWSLRVNGLKSATTEDLKAYVGHASLLINHLYPLKSYAEAELGAIHHSTPVGIEETFPTHSKTNILTTDLKNRPLFTNPTKVDDSILTPKVI